MVVTRSGRHIDSTKPPPAPTERDASPDTIDAEVVLSSFVKHHRRPAPPPSSKSQPQQAQRTHTDLSKPSGRRREELKECTVCFEMLGTTTARELVCMECGFVVHQVCQDRWIARRIADNNKPTCINCNQEWKGGKEVIVLD
ncbi:hypothetical protein M409DRAFT_29519 [Zasmidium cellare ATCC 36951]|uniref:RING-type domain-containing protein n=1 Tax=Zasmidium cellare ATCC 36951 TaxID=1080233 RepID=A0A6A6C3V7_ZASCE|nr:uncharacterized protein M409DRAFT_29519 [Zasmidium cellare ATCC 36951]KAF2160076.1 hypothetical protein M409DRAFT_29519 [Zasmidium cellare ATCC 36951]